MISESQTGMLALAGRVTLFCGYCVGITQLVPPRWSDHHAACVVWAWTVCGWGLFQVLRRDDRCSPWGNAALLCGFCLGVDGLLPPTYGMYALHWILLFGSMGLCGWGIWRCFEHQPRGVPLFAGGAALAVVACFSWLDPLYEMNADPTSFVVGVVLCGVGFIATAEALRLRLYPIGFGCLLFWICAVHVLYDNMPLIRYLPGKRGVGMWGWWVS